LSRVAAGIVVVGILVGAGLTAVAEASFAVVILAFGATGLIMALRVPGNVIGRVFLIATACWAVAGSAELLFAEPLSSVVFTMTFFPGLALAVVALLALFPSGRVLSPGWRWLIWAAVAFGAMGGLGNLLVEIDAGRRAGEMMVSLAGISLIAGVGGGIASLVIRYRRGIDVERQQLKWFLVASFAVPVSLIAGELFVNHPYLQSVIVSAGLIPLPIAVAIAVLRYRLYEIDRILSRTVSYTLVVGSLAAVFFGTVTLLTSILSSASDLVTAAATLMVAAMFNPLRRRVQGAVDRRFNRSRYDAQRVMDGFAESLRDQVDGGEVMSGWVRVVAETMQPAHFSAWIRQ
jgi:hypothetical protein